MPPAWPGRCAVFPVTGRWNWTTVPDGGSLIQAITMAYMRMNAYGRCSRVDHREFRLMPINEEERMDQLNGFIELVTTVIDDGLRARGKPSLFDLDDDGVTLLETIVSPMRELYEEWAQSRHVVLDFAADPQVPARYQAAARLWMAGLLRSSNPERAEEIEARIRIWLYSKYAARVAKTLWSHAQDEGLDGDSLCLGNPPEGKTQAGVMAGIIRLALGYGEGASPPDDESRQGAELRGWIAGLPSGERGLLLATLPELVQGIRPDLSGVDQPAVADRLSMILGEDRPS
jgi:hypothetical protein